MKYSELKDKTMNELSALLKDKKIYLFKLKHQLRTMQLKNPKEISALRKDIARINTAINSLKRG